MPTKLEVLRDTSAALGFVRTIEQTPAGYDCPTHQIPIIEHHVETIGGWQAVFICPSYDGQCRYSPDGEPMQIEPPEGHEPASNAKPAKPGGF